MRQTEGRGGRSQILNKICSNLSGIWSSSSAYKQCSVPNQSRTVRIIGDCGDKWYTDLYRSLHSGSYWQWTKSSIHQNQFRANVASSVYSFTVILSNFRLQIFALLVCYGAQIGIYRRFGTAYPSHLQGSSMTYPWRWNRWESRNFGNYHSTLRNIPEERRLFTPRWKSEITIPEACMCLCTYVHYSAIGILF